MLYRIENKISIGFPDLIIVSPKGVTTYVELKCQRKKMPVIPVHQMGVLSALHKAKARPLVINAVKGTNEIYVYSFKEICK